MKLSKILNKAFKVLTICLFIFTLYFMIASVIANKNNKLVNIFGYSYSYVPTDSMDGSYEDSFKGNSFIIVKFDRFDNVKLHDIIVYQSQIENYNGTDFNILEIHRVIKVNEDGSVVTKGDNPSAVAEKIVTKEIYQGKLVKVFQMPEAFRNFGSIQIVLIFIVIIFLIFFVIYQIIMIFKSIKDEKLKKLKEEEYQKLKAEVEKEIKGE